MGKLRYSEESSSNQKSRVIMSPLVFGIVILLSLLDSCRCWGELGHMIVARIAQNKLVDDRLDPDAFVWAQNLLQTTKSDTFESKWPVVESAGWADRLRSTDRTSAAWHFVATPILANDFAGTYPTPSAEPNITIKLVHMFQTLASPNRDQRGTNLTAQGNALRFAIHLMGDIHQPLHDACKFSKKNPRGDAGANLVSVVFEGKTTNLHSVWDGLFNKVPLARAPLSESSQRLITKAAQEVSSSARLRSEIQSLMALDDYSSLKTYQAIAQESYQLAIDYAHAGVQDGIVLNDTYVGRAYPVVQTRLVEAGLRLAFFISRAYRASLSGIKVRGL